MMAIAGLSAATFADDFKAYEGKNTTFDGNGGEKTTVDGIDFWANGAPPRKFKLLGYIEDTRLKSGLIGKLRMSECPGFNPLSPRKPRKRAETL